MKKLLGMMILALLVASCSLDDAEEFVDNLIPDMSANIDGNLWEADVPVAQLKDGKFIITGAALNGETVVITVNGSDEGSYELSLTSAQCAAVYKETANTSTEDAYPSVSGTVVISEVNSTGKSISGTFTFVVTRGLNDTKQISDGVFEDIRYSESE